MPTVARPRAAPAITGDASSPTPLGQLVAELLAQRRGPQHISRHLPVKFLEQLGMWLCHESIYQANDQPGSALLRPSPLARHRQPFPPAQGGPHYRQGPGQGVAVSVREGPVLTRALGRCSSRTIVVCHEALEARMVDLPAALLRSITRDQGTEWLIILVARSPRAPVLLRLPLAEAARLEREQQWA